MVVMYCSWEGKRRSDVVYGTDLNSSSSYTGSKTKKGRRKFQLLSSKRYGTPYLYFYWFFYHLSPRLRLCVIRKFRYLQKLGYFPLELSQTSDLENFATASRSCCQQMLSTSLPSSTVEFVDDIYTTIRDCDSPQFFCTHCQLSLS